MIIPHLVALPRNIKPCHTQSAILRITMTKVALGGTGIFLSDGATNVMPVAA
jgi:hypothetical protein